MAMLWTLLTLLIIAISTSMLSLMAAGDLVFNGTTQGGVGGCGGGSGGGGGCTVLTYYLQQQFGLNEFLLVGAAQPPVNGTVTGFGLEIVYEFTMTTAADAAASYIMGYVRGTALVVNNTLASTVFMVSNVVHYEYGGLNGTLSQQGEADFSHPPWEFAVVGGTGSFRNARGYNIGTAISATPTPNGTHVVTYYEAHLCNMQAGCC